MSISRYIFSLWEGGEDVRIFVVDFSRRSKSGLSTFPIEGLKDLLFGLRFKDENIIFTLIWLTSNLTFIQIWTLVVVNDIIWISRYGKVFLFIYRLKGNIFFRTLITVEVHTKLFRIGVKFAWIKTIREKLWLHRLYNLRPCSYSPLLWC